MRNIYVITIKRIFPVRGLLLVCFFFFFFWFIFYCKINACTLGTPGGSVVKNPPANARATGKYPLEEKMATCSSILASKILWTEECGRL